MTSTKGKLEVLQSHYQMLGSGSLDAAFDDCRKREVDEKVSEYSHSSECGKGGLDREIKLGEIGKSIRKQQKGW